MARIRTVNRRMAMGVIAATALWLTPALNAERIATQSQVARVIRGAADADTAAFWEMAHDWGQAGQAGLDALLARTDLPDHDQIAQRIGMARLMASRVAYRRDGDDAGRLDKVAELSDLLAIRPEGTPVPVGALTGLRNYDLDAVLRACRRSLPDGRPACVLVLGQFRPDDGEGTRQGILLMGENDPYRPAISVELRGGRISRSGVTWDLTAGRPARISDAQIMQVLDGAFEIAPSREKALFVGEAELIIDN